MALGSKKRAVTLFTQELSAELSAHQQQDSASLSDTALAERKTALESLLTRHEKTYQRLHKKHDRTVMTGFAAGFLGLLSPIPLVMLGGIGLGGLAAVSTVCFAGFVYGLSKAATANAPHTLFEKAKAAEDALATEQTLRQNTSKPAMAKNKKMPRKNFSKAAPKNAAQTSKQQNQKKTPRRGHHGL